MWIYLFAPCLNDLTFWFFFTVNISFIQTDQCQISSFFYQICLPQKCHKNINSWKAVSTGISASLISVGYPVNTRNKSWGGVQHGLWPSVQMGRTGQTQPTCPDGQPLIRTPGVFILSLFRVAHYVVLHMKLADSTVIKELTLVLLLSTNTSFDL